MLGAGGTGIWGSGSDANWLMLMLLFVVSLHCGARIPLPICLVGSAGGRLKMALSVVLGSMNECMLGEGLQVVIMLVELAVVWLLASTLGLAGGQAASGRLFAQ